MKAAKEKKEVMEFYNLNKDQIVFDIKNLIELKEYKKAIELAEWYLITEDEIIFTLYESAKAHYEKVQETEKTQKKDSILAELRLIPTSEFQKNKDLYKELNKMYPQNELYTTKLQFYTKKLKEQNERKKLLAERKEKIESQFSLWDGSHRNLERVIKKLMNDPDSYKHRKTVYWDMNDHLIVMTTFQGKNAFGGVVTNTVKAKVSLDGEVLEIIDQY